MPRMHIYHRKIKFDANFCIDEANTGHNGLGSKVICSRLHEKESVKLSGKSVDSVSMEIYRRVHVLVRDEVSDTIYSICLFTKCLISSGVQFLAKAFNRLNVIFRYF